MSDPTRLERSPRRSLADCGLRVSWKAAWVILLVPTGGFTARRRAWALWWGEFGTSAITAFTALAPLLDVSRLHDTAVNGKPAGKADLRRRPIALPAGGRAFRRLRRTAALMRVRGRRCFKRGLVQPRAEGSCAERGKGHPR